LRKETSGSAPKRHVCSAFRKLNPVLFEGVLRAGGRLSKVPIEFAVKHPVFLPSTHHVTRLIIEEHHKPSVTQECHIRRHCANGTGY